MVRIDQGSIDEEYQDFKVKKITSKGDTVIGDDSNDTVTVNAKVVSNVNINGYTLNNVGGAGFTATQGTSPFTVTSTTPVTNLNADSVDGKHSTDLVLNAGGVPSISAGNTASRPAAGTSGRLYWDTDANRMYRDNGTSWDEVVPKTHTHVAGEVPNLENLNGTLTVAKGGTGATTAADARTNLGVAASSHTHLAEDVPNLESLNGTLTVAKGGTGATTAADARTNLDAAATTHTHAASDITSGTVDLARIPNTLTGKDADTVDGVHAVGFVRFGSGSVAPTTTDIPAGEAKIWKNTGDATVKLYYNDGGTLRSVTLA